MKAILQNFRTGELEVAEVPPPALGPGGILVRNVASLVSAGTEKAIIKLARMNLFQKARARPDLVKKVLRRAAQEGLIGTAQVVANLVSTPLPLGYSCAGVVDAVGSGVSDFKPEDRIACAGLGYANHAEVVFVPRNLAVRIPAGVTFENASFVTLGAIALHGVRQADLRVGEYVVVFGLGLVGLLTVQLCNAAGCTVFGIDLDASRVELAKELGAQDGRTLAEGDAAAAVQRLTRGRGADAVIITAATSSSKPIEVAPDLLRDRGRVVAVGEVGLNIPRRPYYEKEIDLLFSRSYGPGRYDPSYEERGVDYPIGYVRWSENRNMEAFLELVAKGRIRLDSLITHSYPVEDAKRAYELVTGGRQEPFIGIVLRYEPQRPQSSTVKLDKRVGSVIRRASGRASGIRLGVIGAGQFAQGILLPRLRRIRNVDIIGVATGSGLTARRVAQKYGASMCTSDYHDLLRDPNLNAVLIATRHDLHAQIVIDALRAGKHVFVEKPLSIRAEELVDVAKAYREAQRTWDEVPVLTVGFNRRFSPLAAEMKKMFRGQALAITYRVNAGLIPADNWVHDSAVGGGRIVGEVCHFVDFMQFLTGARPVSAFASQLEGVSPALGDPDNLCVTLRFDDGSIGTILYVADGDPAMPKERIEVFGGGAGVIENWRRAVVYHNGKRSVTRSWLGAAKGYTEELRSFVDGVRIGRSPIAFDSLYLTTAATFAIQRSLREGNVVAIDMPSDAADE